MMNPQLADAVPDRLRIARVTKGQTIQTRCDQGSRPLDFQSHSPLPEYLCLFDLDSHTKIVVYELHCVKVAGTRIIAFINGAGTVKNILDHIGESTQPPRAAPARRPPLREAAAAAQQAQSDYQCDGRRPLVPEIEFDQRVAW